VSADPVIGFVRRKSLEDVVDELLRGVASPPPVDHVCRPTRWQQCTHGVHGRRQSLLDRLAELSKPGQEMMPAPDAPSMIRAAGRSTGQHARGAAAGSPAPWSPAAAELLDELLRGAVRAQREGRQTLGLEPATIAVNRKRLRPVRPRTASPVCGPVCRDLWCEHPSCLAIAGLEVEWLNQDLPITSLALEQAGRHALQALPGLVQLLADRDHPLGVKITGEREIRTQGLIESRVRGWHQRALTLTGHELPLERLPELPNPDHKWSMPARLVSAGPVCEQAGCEHPSCWSVRWPALPGQRLGPVCTSCAHSSCRRIRSGRRRWLRWACPTCGADSLRRDPVTDLVHCLRPSCVDVDGRPSTWHMADLADGSGDPWGDLA